MAPPFKKLSLIEFEASVASFDWNPSKTKIHVHCTESPDHARFEEVGGLECVEGMYRYHTEEKGWKDIAQHITIDPEGFVWTGRPWNWSPASALGYNSKNVFMFEMIGLFDEGDDPFQNPQDHAAYVVTAAIIQKFGLVAEDAIVFHNEINTTGKTCPGSAIDKDDFIASVEEVLEERFMARSFGLPGNVNFGPTQLDLSYDLPNLVDGLDSSEEKGPPDEGEVF